MRLVIRPDFKDISNFTALYIKQRILDFAPTPERPFVLGLPTGSSPLGVYKKLIEYHQRGELSFRHVITFNMDEYVQLARDHPESYHSFMWNNFFKHIDILPENAHILNGNAASLEDECDRYEQLIKQVGGIELFLGGIGPGTSTHPPNLTREFGGGDGFHAGCVSLMHDGMVDKKMGTLRSTSPARR